MQQNICIQDGMESCSFIISAQEETQTDVSGITSTTIDVSYSKPQFVGGQAGLELHPLYDKCEKYQDLDGVRVHKNEVTAAMVKHLLMSENELQKFISPLTEPIRYKCDIIKGLALHWI